MGQTETFTSVSVLTALLLRHPKFGVGTKRHHRTEYRSNSFLLSTKDSKNSCHCTLFISLQPAMPGRHTKWFQIKSKGAGEASVTGTSQLIFYQQDQINCVGLLHWLHLLPDLRHESCIYPMATNTESSLQCLCFSYKDTTWKAVQQCL